MEGTKTALGLAEGPRLTRILGLEKNSNKQNSR